MKTWADYKEYVKGIDEQSRQEMEEIEIIAGIIGAMIDKRNELGYSQRDLAELCGMPQSSIARINEDYAELEYSSEIDAAVRA